MNTEKELEFMAELNDSIGIRSVGGELHKSVELGRKIISKTDDDGNCSFPDRYIEHAKVEFVTYKAKGWGVPFYDCEHRLTWEEFVKMGRPQKITIKKKWEYIPIAEEVVLSSQ